MIGGYGRGRRHRRMFYSTGIPGCGRGRCVWTLPVPVPPDFVYPETRPDAMDPYGPMVQGLSEQDELKMLEEEEQLLRQELEELTAAVQQLKEKIEKEVNR